ncbi:MAG: HAD family hydrolase [Acetobacter sp.]|nr:HAD family hydrolase [Bacteroides sp.]MCM1341706.1 HAD family hydrolase [Acetobacter sp.]MCM1432355.1 HAD family hydrolase [Clostridiales bacterium]
MKYKYVIWDWNGTLFDDIKISIDTINEMLKVKNYQHTIDEKKYKEIFCFPVVEYYKNAGIDLNKHSFEEMAAIYIERYDEKQKSCCLFKNAEKTLKALNENGINQLVISVSEKERLEKQIRRFGIVQYLSAVLGADDYYAVSKVDIAKKYFCENNINAHEVLFAGDTVHDYEVASAVGCDCILISAGHQCENVLEQTGTVIIDDIEKILGYIC